MGFYFINNRAICQLFLFDNLALLLIHPLLTVYTPAINKTIKE